MNRARSIMGLVGLGAAAALSAMGCNAVLGLDERPARQGPSTGGTGPVTSGAGAGCPGCVESTPDGWSGPVAVRRGSGDVTCDDGLNTELRLFDVLVAPPAECACDCEDPTGIDCATTAATVLAFDDNSCADGEDTQTAVLGQCVGLCCGVDSGNFTPMTPNVAGASCAPTVVADATPMATWDEGVVGCGPVESSPCGETACFDVPASADLCIYRAGEHACPAGSFTAGQVWYADFTDDRACSVCGCAGVEGASCNEVVVGYSDGNCNNNPGTLVAAPGCVQAPVDYSSARVETVNPTGSCSPTGGDAIGAAQASSPTTLCCLP